MEYTKKIGYMVIGVITLVLAVLAQWQTTQHKVGHPKLVVLNIGQGDAIYLHTEQGADILIDGGPDRTVLERLGEVMPFWDRTIELVVLTHPHADHLNGLVALLDYYHVEQVWLTKVSQEHNVTNQLWLKGLANQDTKIQYVQAGETWSLSDHEIFRVLYPFADTPLDAIEDLNDTSVVTQYEFSGHKVLLMGDVTSNVESQLLAQQVLSPVDILKVCHHGSRYSSSPEFLAVVHPQIAIISAGIDNDYHHPHTETLERLKNIGTKIYRTDQMGNIELSLPSP